MSEIQQNLAGRTGIFAEWLECHPALVLIALSAIYFVSTAYLASSKPLWDDEFFTLYIARAGFHGAWQALLTGADQHPPTFYWLTYLFIKPLGFHHVLFRLPQILGFWAMLMCVFVVIARRTTNLIAYTAILFPCLTKAYYYASEGRGYGVLVGASAAAYLCWENAVAGKRRRLNVPLFGFFLAACVCCHYYGVLVAIPFALAEAFRFWKTKRPDIPLWLGFLAPIVPLLCFLPLIRSSHGYSGHFWAAATPGKIADSFYLVFSSASTTLFYIVVVVFLFLAFGRPSNRPENEPDPRFPMRLERFQSAAVLGWLMIPFFGYLLAHYVTHGLSPRYLITCEIGVIVAVAFFLDRLSRGWKTLQLALFLLVLVRFQMNVRANRAINLLARQDIDHTAQLIQSYTAKGFPVAVAEVTVFHKLTFYGPPDLKGKMFYLLDPAASIRYLGHDTIERGLSDLKPWFHEDAVPYRQFVDEHPDFYAYGYVGPWTWLTYKLAEDKLECLFVERDADRIVFKVHRP